MVSAGTRYSHGCFEKLKISRSKNDAMPKGLDSNSLVNSKRARAIYITLIYRKQKNITAHALIVGTGSILQLKSNSHDHIRFYIYNAVLYTVKIMPSKQCSLLIVIIHRPLRPSED